MKRNVDLTANRFFSSNLFNGIITISMITNEKFPWNTSFSIIKSDDDLDLEHQRNAIIAMGNKATRAKIKFYREMDDSNYCDCCGKRMNLKPWYKEIGVCHKCNNYYLKDKDKCKWRKKETIENAII